MSLLLFCAAGPAFGQASLPAKIELGSRTARNGFRNENEIAAKFNNWRTDEEAKIWLSAMGYRLQDVRSVSTVKPHGEKADVLLSIKTGSRESSEGISIKLVSSSNGFNQIDKRWLSHYAKMWQMPLDVVEALKLFVGETTPPGTSRNAERMFLNELGKEKQKAVVDFFTTKKADIVSDLFEGDGVYSAGWILVALRNSEKPRWILRRIDRAIEFYSQGDVAITRGGNLRIGGITMQRKGGDGGRETAKMLQFKIDPTELFDRP